MTAKTLNVALIGYKFMGKAHSHAWKTAPDFFDLKARPVLKVVAGRHEQPLKEFAGRWGWQETATDWREVIARDDIDIVDISVPTALHCEIVMAAAKAGKHIFCEKPFALNMKEARKMRDAAKKAGVIHYLNHNYRRCPAVMLAKRMIDDGKLGRIYHWRGAYLQSWIMDPNFPLTWQLQKKHAGAGPQWDLNSHSVDLARFLVGEIQNVQAMTAHFINERPLPAATDGAFKIATRKSAAKGKVTVEDAAFMIAEFENGTLGSFETTRFATGRKNYNTFEIYGAKGALTFNLERMNELKYCNATDPNGEQGFRSILVTESEHPYIANWWPPGHIIGYEHAFVHAVADFVDAVARQKPITPDFTDGVKIMQVLEAGLQSAHTGKRVAVQSC